MIDFAGLDQMCKNVEVSPKLRSMLRGDSVNAFSISLDPLNPRILEPSLIHTQAWLAASFIEKLQPIGRRSENVYLFHVEFFEIEPVTGFTHVIQLELNRIDVIVFNFQKPLKQGLTFVR